MIPRNLKHGGIGKKCYPCPASDMSLGPMTVGRQTLRGHIIKSVRVKVTIHTLQSG